MDKSQIPISKQRVYGLWSMVYGLLVICNLVLGICPLFAEEIKEQPTIINGDVVEYSTDNKEVTVTGNAVVNSKGTKLTAQKLTMNTQTQDAIAFGNARLDSAQAVVEGTKIIYNFQTQKGTIIDSEFRSNPYFGQAEKSEKVSDDELIFRRGYFTTCSYDRPHWRMKSRKMNVFPGDKIQTQDDTFYLKKIPFFYMPRYNHSLKDPMAHVQLMPGSSKDWGKYLLTAWRYNLTEDVTGRIYFDARERLGVAEGLGVNYTTQELGNGDFKYYYTQERPKRLEEGVPAEFQRYLIRLRHKWNIDARTNAILQYYKIEDSKRASKGTITAGGSSTPYDFSSSNFLKDYFFREYEKDAQPLSYVSAHHNFNYSSLDFLMQKRTNRWYSQAEMLPQITFTLPDYQIGKTPLYFENTTSFVNYNYKNAVPSPSWNDTSYTKFDMTNTISLPIKIFFLSATPSFSNYLSISNRGIIYAQNLDAATLLAAAIDLTTKFYRIFPVKTNFLGLDINDLRHIITPGLGYSYQQTATPTDKFRLGGGTTSYPIPLSLGNKLQTKRKGQRVDLVDFRISSAYTIETEKGERKGSCFSDFLFNLELRPYSWLRIVSDATYVHSGARADIGYRRFSNANYDIGVDFGKERTIKIGQRYQRKAGNEITYSFDWRLTPKWKFFLYHRRNRGHDPTLKRGIREQEYRISRDFHCWIVEFTYNRKVGIGESVWLVFRLKAFPELEFEYNQEYHMPKPGTQSNP